MGDLNYVLINMIIYKANMIKRFTTTILTIFFVAVLAIPASAQMTDDQVMSYTKEQMAAGKSSEEIAKELATKGVTMEQLRRLQSYGKATTGMNSFNTTRTEVGGQERMRRLAGTMNQNTKALDEVTDKFSKVPQQQMMNQTGVVADPKNPLVNQMPNQQTPMLQDPAMMTDSTMAQFYDPTLVEEKIEIFGHNIFKQNNLSFAPNENIATPEDYKLGPGDEVFIDIWGANQATIRQTISPDGFIVVENYGVLPLNGLTVKEAENFAKKQLGKIYSIDGEDPMSEIKLTLGSVRTINVNVVGEVTYPGTYHMSSLSSVYHALYIAGGFTDLGSVRKISLIRNGNELTQVDIYDFLISGTKADDTILQEGDIVVVPTFDNLVTIEGNVKRPMAYETLEGETVEDVITFAGGFKGDAYTPHLKIARRNGRELQVRTVLEADYANATVMDGDLLTVSEILDRYENRVEIVGAVYRPGEYELCPEINSVKKLIAIADGLKGDAFLNRAIIQREKPDYTLETIAFDLKALIDNGIAEVELKNNDILYISSIHDLQDIGDITINGEVARPGTYVFAANTTIEDAIIQAGGLLESASTAKVDVSRRIKDPSSQAISDTLSYTFTYTIKDGLVVGGEEFVLEPFDCIYVRKSPTYNPQLHVTIEGEVVFPGMYALTQREYRLSDLVNHAGGVTNWSYIEGAKLIRQMSEEEKVIAQAALEAMENVGVSEDSTAVTPLKTEYSVGIELGKALANPKSDLDVVLRDGDKLIIPEYTNTVKISGEVMYPNVVTYNPNMTVRKYITMAGGYGNMAKKSKAYVVYMNGNVSKARGISRKVVEPGCEIIVPIKLKNDQLPSTIASFVSATSSSASLLTTLYALVRTLSK